MECKHSIGRAHGNESDFLSTLLPGGKQFVLDAVGGPRLVCGADSLMMIGFSRNVVERADRAGFSQHFMADLAGNAFAGPIPVAIMLSIVANLTDDMIDVFNKHAEQPTTAPIVGDSESLDIDVDNIADLMIS